jgi:hypothetical protein
MAKNFTLAIVSKCDVITCCVILLKRCEHPLLLSYDWYTHYQALNSFYRRSRSTRKNQALFLGSQTYLGPFNLVTSTLL